MDGLTLLKTQGAMEVYSKALDDVFRDEDVRPRHRLLSTTIDYGLDMVDCATVEFVDPDYKVAYAVRNGSTEDGKKVLYTPWTAKIGYYDLPESEWTTLVGVPQLEVPTFPESGPPTTKIKIFSASVVLQKNTTDGADPSNYLEPFQDHPFRRSLEAIANFYGLSTDFGELEEAIDQIDQAFYINYKMLKQYDYVERGEYLQTRGSSKLSIDPFLISCTAELCRRENENDYQWLKRAADIVTQYIHCNAIRLDPQLMKYFASQMPGMVSKSDLKVVFGIYAGSLVFKLSREYLRDIGFKKGIPVVEYRSGNDLLRSFEGSTVEANSNTGAFASFFNLFVKNSGKKQTTVDIQGPLPFVKPSTGDDIAKSSLNVYGKDLYQRFSCSLPVNSPAYTAAWVDHMKRSLDMTIEGTVKTFGIPKLMAGQLIGCNGLGRGPDSAVSDESIEQNFANYNRIYLIKQATHKMSSPGLYELTAKVGGCSIDGSEKKLLQQLNDQLSSGLEPQTGGEGWLAKLLKYL